MPNILVDENVPKSVSDWLKSRGFTVVNVYETGLKGTKDQAIAE